MGLSGNEETTVNGGEFYYHPAGHAEVAAALFGVEKALEVGLTQPVLESDCMVLIQHLQRRVFPDNELGTWLMNLDLLLGHCLSCSFVHVKRDLNAVADCFFFCC
ncbi:hypothetical protein JCGZ_25710 [Jatropha curcas]|uniref:RNase H type-1 domain-containing protein n=1 Tax=Jatropha curcas TaxID=180498 RepID=A0A067JYY3_JATCU|nr:hypothetical protein JCGZ_25710 [Jatropha curcas]